MWTCKGFLLELRYTELNQTEWKGCLNDSHKRDPKRWVKAMAVSRVKWNIIERCDWDGSDGEVLRQRSGMRVTLTRQPIKRTRRPRIEIAVDGAEDVAGTLEAWKGLEARFLSLTTHV